MTSLDLHGATVLVTGAGGFVGPHLARALAARGAEVHGTGGPRPQDAPLAEWHPSDLFDPASLATAVRASRPHAVVHLAGQSSAARSFQDPIETFRLNALGTWHLLRALEMHAPRARVLAVTSGEIYGPGAPGTRSAEDARFDPVNPYALSKAAADAYAAAAAARGQDVIRARAFGHTGPGQTPAFVIPAMGQQIAAIEAGGGAPVLRVGNLDVVRDLSDVRDVVLAYVALLESGRTGAAYNVCRGEGARLADVVARMVAMARVPIRIEVDPARLRPADVPWLVGDPSAIERDTGWRVAIPLERTLADVLADWRARKRP